MTLYHPLCSQPVTLQLARLATGTSRTDEAPFFYFSWVFLFIFSRIDIHIKHGKFVTERFSQLNISSDVKSILVGHSCNFFLPFLLCTQLTVSVKALHILFFKFVQEISYSFLLEPSYKSSDASSHYEAKEFAFARILTDTGPLSPKQAR